MADHLHTTNENNCFPLPTVLTQKKKNKIQFHTGNATIYRI